MNLIEESYQDKYNAWYNRTRKQIEEWLKNKGHIDHKKAQYILLAPDFFMLLVSLGLDKDVPMEHRAKLYLAVMYFLSPIDLMPEAILGPIGYIDDIALAAYVLDSLLNDVDDLVVRRHWQGEGDILVQIKEILSKANDWIGSGLWEKVKGKIKG